MNKLVFIGHGNWRQFDLNNDKDPVFRALYRRIKLYDLLEEARR
jgi:hypothetical protein